MKIVFIEPKAPDVHVYTRMPLPRLGTLLLGTTLRDKGYKIKVQIEALGDFDISAVAEADVIAISIITDTAPAGYEMARQLRPLKKPIVFGGPHATYMPEETLRYGDFVLRGEADETMLSFIRALEINKGFEEIPGLSFWKNGAMMHNERPAYCQNLDILPTPDFNLIANQQKRMSVTPIMTSRGCPYDCEFCSVSNMFGRQYRFRSPEKVLAELENHKRIIKENKVKDQNDWVFFYDDNFSINKKRTKELLRAMLEAKLTPKYWTAQASIDVARDEELLYLMKKSGCYLLYIGIESINPKTLKEYNKKQTTEDIEKAIKIIHRHGIRIHGMFVFGADNDDKKVIDDTIRFAKKNNLHSVQFLILTPLPGTRTFGKLNKQGRIFNKQWNLYDAHHCVFTPKNFSAWGLQSGTMKAMLKFYSWPHIFRRALQLLLRFKNFKEAILEASLNIYGRRSTKEWIGKKKEWLKSLRIKLGH
ncbi:MAG: radical SAM protein [Patescibacteria group bacterium]